MMASCLAIRPSQLALRRGLSFYGNHLQTIVPFSVGFASCVALTALGLARLRPIDASSRRLRRCMVALLVLMALVPLTPYSVDLVFDYLHTIVSASLFAAAALLAVWLAMWVIRSHLAYAALSALGVAGVCALTAQIGLHRYMIPSELAYDVALAVLIVLGLVERSTLAACD